MDKIGVILWVIGFCWIIGLAVLKAAGKTGNTRKGLPLWLMVTAIATWITGAVMVSLP